MPVALDPTLYIPVLVVIAVVAVVGVISDKIFG